jgi:hypothetical protein
VAVPVLNAGLRGTACLTANGHTVFHSVRRVANVALKRHPLKLSPAPPDALARPGWCAKGNSRSYFFCSSRM